MIIIINRTFLICDKTNNEFSFQFYFFNSVKNTLFCFYSKLFRFSINKTNYSGENTGFNSTLIDSKSLSNVSDLNTNILANKKYFKLYNL